MIQFICLVPLLFIIEVEKRINKKGLSPLYLIVMVYLCGVCVANTIGVYFGYYPVSITTILYLSTYFLEILVISMCSKAVIYNEKYDTTNQEVKLKNVKLLISIYIIATVAFASYFLSIFDAKDLFYTKGKSAGVYGHLSLLGLSMTPLLFFEWRRTKKIIYIIPAIILMCITAFFAKYYVCITAFAIAIFLLQNKKISHLMIIKSFVCALIFGITLFIAIYSLIPTLFLDNFSFELFIDTVPDSIEHFLYYFISPFICQNYFFSNGGKYDLYLGIESVLSPVVTIYEYFIGNGNYPSALGGWVQISHSAHMTHGNVGGIFSETFNIIGDWSYIYIFFVSLLVYFFYYQSKLKNKFHLTAAFSIGIFTFCYFSNFFRLLSIYELLIYSLIVDFIFIKRQNTR